MSTWRIAAAIIVPIALVLIPFLLFGDALDQQMNRWILADRGVAAIAGTCLLALDIVLPVPSSIVATSMGSLLGGPAGAFVNAIGLTIGCMFGLILGRAGSPLARQILGPQFFAAFVAWVQRYGVVALIVCRAVPVLAEASVFALGAARGRTLPLIAAATLTDIGLGAAYAFAGAANGPTAAPYAPALIAAIGVPAIASLAALAWTCRNARG